MDFFKSVFSEDPDPPKYDSGSSPIVYERGSNSPGSDPDTPTEQRESSPDPEIESTSMWSFGGLIKTLTVKSESVIQTYRRDLQEFGVGLKKEIEVVQGSLETVSHTIDEIGSNVIKGTAQIISHGKEVILAADLESDSSDSHQNRSFNSKRYSRFDSQVRAVQCDVGTYLEEPEDLSDYSKWKSVFVLEENKEDVESLLKENEAVESVYRRVVPGSVDHQTFWCRYFYKVYKLKQAEELRAKLVNRAISTEEEELTWDFDDSDDENDAKNDLVPKENQEMGKNTSDIAEKLQVASQNVEEMSIDEKDSDQLVKKDSENDLASKENREVSMKTSDDIIEKSQADSTNVERARTDDQGMNEVSRSDSLENKALAGNDFDQLAKDNVDDDIVGKAAVESSTKPADGKEALSGKSCGANNEEAETKLNDQVMNLEEKSDHGTESCKGSDYSVVSSQPMMPEEDDLGWDEIEDLSGIDDDKKTIQGGGSPNRADLRKRLSVAEEEEDLSWDIEDDDE